MCMRLQDVHAVVPVACSRADPFLYYRYIPPTEGKNKNELIDRRLFVCLFCANRAWCPAGHLRRPFLQLQLQVLLNRQISDYDKATEARTVRVRRLGPIVPVLQQLGIFSLCPLRVGGPFCPLPARVTSSRCWSDCSPPPQPGPCTLPHYPRPVALRLLRSGLVPQPVPNRYV